MRMISVGFDRPSKPRGCLLPMTEVVLGQAHVKHPDIGHRIARAEAKGLGNVSLRIFGAADVNLTESHKGMGAGEISIDPGTRLAATAPSPGSAFPRSSP